MVQHRQNNRNHGLLSMNELQYDLFRSIINNINIEIMEHGNFTGDSEWKYYNINSPFNRLYFVLEGLGHIRNKCEELDLLPGNIYLIPLHTTHDYICNSHVKKFYLHFKSELFPGNDIFDNVLLPMSMPFDADLVDKLLNKVGSSNISDIAWCKAIFLDIIYSFITPHEYDIDRQVRKIIKYKNILNYIRNNSPAKITISQLAAQMNMSVSCFSKSFKLDTGVSPKVYIKNYILKVAKEILLVQDSAIKQVAYQLGFTDEFYFSRFFKKETGLAPREYRYQNSMK